MTVATDTIRNGVDTEQMFATLDLIKAQPELAKFRFRATNRWIDGAHNRSTIKGFYAAGGEDTTRSEAFELDAGEPAILLAQSTPAPTRLSSYCTRWPPVSRRRSSTWRRRARSELTSVESTLTGDMDVRGALGVDDEPRNGFERISVSFRVTGNAPEEKLREAADRARKRSAVYDMVTNGVPVAVEVATDWRLAAGPWPGRCSGHGRLGERIGDPAMPVELTALTEAGSHLVAIAEQLSTELAARAAEHDRDGSYPFEVIEALKAASYFAAPVPVELGGLGVSSAHDLVVASSRLARGDASVAIGVNMHLVAVLNMERRRQVAVAAGTGAPRTRLHLLARAGRPRRRRTSRRHQRARPGPHPPGHPRHAHGVRLADRRPQAVLHDAPPPPPTSTWRSRTPTARASSATPTPWCPPTPPGS